MVGIRPFPFGMASFQVRTVSFREGRSLKFQDRTDFCKVGPLPILYLVWNHSGISRVIVYNIWLPVYKANLGVITPFISRTSKGLPCIEFRRCVSAKASIISDKKTHGKINNTPYIKWLWCKNPGRHKLLCLTYTLIFQSQCFGCYACFREGNDEIKTVFLETTSSGFRFNHCPTWLSLIHCSIGKGQKIYIFPQMLT